MNTYRRLAALALGPLCLIIAQACFADADYKVVTVIDAATLDEAEKTAPADRVSDQPIRHEESAEGNLGIGVVHRPVIEAGDIVIIPAGVAHGFSEITAAITYMVVRIDPDKLVALK